ncbi:hypothetical protein VCHC68A1_01248B, partial [Vibrio cholerae HC-68A1]|jgi:hypothetical protein
LAQ